MVRDNLPPGVGPTDFPGMDALRNADFNTSQHAAEISTELLRIGGLF